MGQKIETQHTTKKGGDVVVEDNTVVLPDFESIQEAKHINKIEDTIKGAVRFAFAGFGQAGSNIVSTFYDIGYRRCAVFFTTPQDTQSSPVQHKLFMDIGSGGAGKDIEKGKQAAQKYAIEIANTMRLAFGSDVEKIFCVAGLGGGTGSLSVIEGITRAKDISREIGIEGDTPVGAIITLPSLTEGTTVNHNAATALELLLDMVKMDSISPLIILDNERAGKLYSKLPIGRVYKIINRNLATIFNMFNVIAEQPSTISTFDKADFMALLNSGIIIFGASPVGDYSDSENIIADAIKRNIQIGVFAEGFDLKTADTYGLIIAASDDIIENKLTKAQIDASMRTLNSILSDEVNAYVGVLKTQDDRFDLYLMLGGLDFPESRLLKLKSGKF